MSWITLAFGVGVGVGVGLGGILWSGAAIEYRRRWREAVKIMQRMDDERTLPRPHKALSAPDRERVQAIMRRYKHRKEAA